jgi:hypothetical protein
MKGHYFPKELCKTLEELAYAPAARADDIAQKIDTLIDVGRRMMGWIGK